MAETDRSYTKLGADTAAWCLRHRRMVRWIPAPGWWIHDDDLPMVGGLGDSRSCSALWNAPSPLVLVWDDTGEVFYPEPVGQRVGAVAAASV